MAINKTKKLRELFGEKDLIKIVGAHDALSAKLVEKYGFDGVWASGFEISTSHGVPDASILTMTDYLRATDSMNKAVSIPVIADVDTGFGNANNVIEMVRQYETAGIPAVCMEDKCFPKVNTYIPGRQPLAPIPEFVGKILAAKNTQNDKDFMVFARIEALIAGWGQDEAIKRALAYNEAGADAILIHSKSKTPDEIIEFARRWNKKSPLIIVPTSYPSFREEEMKKNGIKMVIYANHAIRSSIKGMENALEKIAKGGLSEIKEGTDIVSMKDTFELQGMTQFKEDEKKYLSGVYGSFQAVIPAAADHRKYSHSLESLLEDLPLTMLNINGKPLLQRTVEMLNNEGIQDIKVIGGYKSDKIDIEGIELVKNPNYEKTGIMYSIINATKESKKKTLMIYSDILMNREVIDKLIQSEKDITLVIDGSYSQKNKDNLDLVIAKYDALKEDRIISLRKNNEIVSIGKNLDQRKANYEFAGAALFSKEGFESLKHEYNTLKNKEEISFTDMLQTMIDRGYKVYGLEINKGWAEIRNFDDYKRVSSMIAEMEK